jgi:hypothetical protein
LCVVVYMNGLAILAFVCSSIHEWACYISFCVYVNMLAMQAFVCVGMNGPAIAAFVYT